MTTGFTRVKGKATAQEVFALVCYAEIILHLKA